MKAQLNSKKGFFFYVEIMVVVLLAVLIWMGFPTSQQAYLDSASRDDLHDLGYTYLKALDVSGILPKYINQTNVTGTNFTKLDGYVANGLPRSIIVKTEYIYNETLCYNATGSSGSCGLNITSPDTITTIYTFTNSSEPLSIKLYLKSAFGGHT